MVGVRKYCLSARALGTRHKRLARVETRMANKKKGILRLEGDWWGVRDKTSVEPMLRLLETKGNYKVPYFHHDLPSERASVGCM